MNTARSGEPSDEQERVNQHKSGAHHIHGDPIPVFGKFVVLF